MAQLVTHLGVFALDNRTGAPLLRVPVYAEVGTHGTVENVPDAPLDERFIDQIQIASRDADNACFNDDACRGRMRTALEQGLSRLLAQGTRDQLSDDADRAVEFLSRVIIARAMRALQQDPQAPLDTTIWLYPLVHDLQKFDALAQARFAHDAIVVRLELQPPNLPVVIQNAGFPALQNPDLTDWRISPASFATNPGSLVGADGCETLLPANVALQEFHFYQVVRLTDVIMPPNLPPDLQQQVRLGLALDYRMTWYPLGHSLGQIQYSLPLAPGESVNLAVIDWTRRDETTRAEDTKLNERYYLFV